MTSTEFDFPQLDSPPRELMLDELAIDEQARDVYVDSRLTVDGASTYLQMLNVVLRGDGPDALARALEPVPGICWQAVVRDAQGRLAETPPSAARVLAEGEFNRYYMRAICRRAVSDGDGRVRVRLGKPPEAVSTDPLVRVREGQVIGALPALADLRLHPWVPTGLGMPRLADSGLTLVFVTRR